MAEQSSLPKKVGSIQRLAERDRVSLSSRFTLYQYTVSETHVFSQSMLNGFKLGTLQCTPVASFYGCWDRPNIVAPVQIFSNPRTVQTLPGSTGVTRTGNFYFAPASFAREGCSSPTQLIATCGFGIGNAGRNLFHGPGINNWDISFYKDTNIRENIKLQLRVDLFNAFNHTQFNNPSGSVTSSLFGRITTTRIPARITQLSASFTF